MGTSSSYSGPGRGSPLLPPWADADDSGTAPPNGPDTAPDESPDTQPADSTERPPTHPQPAQVNIGPARNHIRQYASGAGVGSLRRGVRSYVRGMGGARGAATSARAGRNATRRLGGFLSNAATRGVEAALNRLDLGHVLGNPVEVVLATVEDVLAPDGASLDEAVARSAMSATLRDLYQRYSLEEEGIYALDGMDADGVRAAIHLYVTNYIYERLLSIMQRDLESQSLSEEELIRAEHEIRSFTRETVRLELDDVDVLAVDWNEGQGEEIIEQAFEQGYAIWEAIQP